MALVLATVGLGLNLRAWILLGPHLHERFAVGTGHYVLLMGLPLLVAALVRLPVGVLTDRYGARVMFPAVCLASAACVFGLGLTSSLPVAVLAGSAAGVASSAFVVGAALLSRLFPYGRRGLALGVFTLGPVVAALVSALSRGADQYGRGAAVVLGSSLIVVAALSAGVFRDPVGPHRRRSGLRRCVEMVVVASRTSLSLLYGLALGGLVAASIYLPIYLTAAFGLGWFHALTLTGIVIILSAFARLVGGWWTDRRPTARLLVACYMIAAGLCLVVAVEPRRWWLAASMIALGAVCDGLASGALLALIGKAARDDSAGAVMGVTGAVAALAALLPPLLLAGVSRLGHSYSAAWVLLAAFLLGVALYVRAHGLRVGLGLVVQFQPGPSATRMTVAVVGEPDMDIGAAAVVARVAELASTDVLVVVFGSDADDRARDERGGGGRRRTDADDRARHERGGGGRRRTDADDRARHERGGGGRRGTDGPYEFTPARLSTNALVAGLRDRLPRHSVVALRAAAHTAGLDQLATSLDELLDSGTVAIAVTSSADIHEVAAHLASHLKADRILAVVYTPLRGAAAHEVWRREPMTR